MLKIPTGIDDFRKIREGHYTYIDKTLVIEEVLNNSADIQLITRPRRFGKTLNMSTMATFFDHKADSAALFKGLAIETRPCFKHCGAYPVIFLSFKQLKAANFEIFVGLFSEMACTLYESHEAILPRLSESQQAFFKTILSRTRDTSYLIRAISNLMYFLQKVHGKRVMLFLDEYDNPIQEAYSLGYYDEVIPFMRGVLGEALKGNTALEKSVLTGILRVGKESIFSDLNNLEVLTVLNKNFADKFGFVEDEVLWLLDEAGCRDREEAVRDWYNGYSIGKDRVYNPWSVLCFLKDGGEICQPHWLNTSTNRLIHELLLSAGEDTHAQLTELMTGGTVRTYIQSQTALSDLDGRALWSLLLYSGYLTMESWEQDGLRIAYFLRIPNQEILLLYQDIFMDWLDKGLGEMTMPRMLKALTTGDVPAFGRDLASLIKVTLSYYDTGGPQPERVYHAFVLGLLAHLNQRYDIRSNRESGYGRYDVMMLPKDKSLKGVILEFKIAETPDDLDKALAEGLAQIEAEDYATELRAQGITRHVEIAVAFCGKQVKVEGRQN